MKRIGTLLILLAALLGLRPEAQAQTCTPPTNISAIAASASSVTVNFTPVASAASYTVRYWWVYDSLMTNTQTLTVPAPPATITGLQYAAYRYTVTSNCSATSGATSAPQVVQLPLLGCGTPDSVRVYATGTTTAAVQYLPVSGATQYYVQCLLAGTTITAASASSTTTTATLSGLQPGTAYVVRVYAACASGISPLSAGTGFSTSAINPNPTGCDSVRGFNVSLITATSAQVAFTRAVGPVSYTVTYRPLGSTGAGISTTTTSSPLVLSGLQASTTYVVTIRANCTATSSSAVSSTSFTTPSVASCGAITNLVVTATSATTATLNFTPGVGNTGFNVSYYSPADSLNAQYFSTASTPVVLTGLVAGQTYIIRITSVCGTATSTFYNNSSGPITLIFRGALANRSTLGAGVLSVFPNPAHHAASLVLPAVPGAGQAQLVLLNALGQQVRALAVPLATAGETRTQLDLSGIGPGLYTLRVQAGGQSASQRLVVE